MPGAYISYPFCNQKCTFCNFASDVGGAGVRADYEQALLREVEGHEWNWLPETVYFGGGTPSLMPLEMFRELMSAIPGERLSEVTIECAPGTVTNERIRTWKQCGVNRISLGVQSFVDEELRRTGRRHDAAVVQSEVQMLRESGITNINIDLIAGLPGQTMESWERSLDWVERLSPPHVSVYLFEADEDSRLGKEFLAGGIRYGAGCLPSDDLMATMYQRTLERLAGCGILRYEVSNFAKRGCESRHNRKYWELAPYVGFGLDAHSFDGRRRWSNPDTLNAYLCGDGEQAKRTETDTQEEHFFVGLRLTDGIEPTEAEWERFAEPITKWLGSGMLEREGGRLRLSADGVLLSNEVLQDFTGA